MLEVDDESTQASCASDTFGLLYCSQFLVEEMGRLQ